MTDGFLLYHKKYRLKNCGKGKPRKPEKETLKGPGKLQTITL